jgi:hypothetical protein
MSTSQSAEASRMPPSLVRLGQAFVAGGLAVPVFHQILLWILHAAGIVPNAPFNMAPTKPLGIPEIVSISFWGGVWGVVFALTLPRWFSGTAYWIAAPVAGGVALTLVFMLVVWPLKFGGLPPDPLGHFIVGLLLNAAWGIGWALFLHWFERMRSA